MAEVKISKLEAWKQRAKEFEGRIPELINNGIKYHPLGDMVVYCQVVTPNMSEEDLEGSDDLVLEAMFDGDLEGDVTDRKFVILAVGPKCESGIKPGDHAQIRGHAFQVTLPGGTKAFTVREYDIVGKYEKAFI